MLKKVNKLKSIIDTAHSAGIWVGMCGEMASEPAFIPILLGLGLDEISSSAVSIPEIKKIIRSLTYVEAEKIANKVLQLSTAAQIAEYTKRKINELISNKV